VALQGTLDTFALPDVLRLLASTSKSGCLRVSGSRGDGDIWFESGGVVAAATATPLPTTNPVEVLCELLRCSDGHFAFESGATVEHDGAPADIEPLLVEAEQLVAEWEAIEAVVPSLDAWVALVEDLPKAKVSVDARSWKVILAVAGGSTVRDIGAWMNLGELGVSRAVRDLVKIGLATVSDAPVAVGPDAVYETFEPVADQGDWEHAAPWAEDTQWVEDAGYLSHTPPPKPAPVYEEIADPEPVEPFRPFDRPEPETLAEALPDIPDTIDDPVVDEPVIDEAAPEIVEEQVEEPVEEPAPIDRSRLLKFLGSVGK